ncbi:helix-turn-helix domain-containing protein [Sphingomonas sp. SRS2]|uniref:helix-turn-helix domain-containing protein n=1 Tax=Sphingomonas sp. SRS2 TaxID=133190 RepID=UPI00061840BB|nr:helix-turn-helix domain-containing protein [Sphingomonas sp. SRS2]KKC23870.1 hypothetical protein WP12_22510 [Sphingomonas sp. SRS2]
MSDAIDRAERAKRGSPFLNTDQAAHYLGLSRRFLQKLRSKGEGPLHRHHSTMVQYHIDDLQDWSQSQTRGARS